ncbi:MAG: hypothetical protein MRERV_4c028 [Mycoplasmataceae bacterium RV_VA103A]|nr:MAG: hypothetical protein MRERV_23c023 [Mycoplasmataceae bacterium RV_VA103A]KLL05142.1 MAG: hypothetical protein MRERV_4c028 [Mycoplasmataceae bacterium RV_VA103A]
MLLTEQDNKLGLFKSFFFFFLLFAPTTNNQIIKTKSNKKIIQINFCHQGEGEALPPPG